jgi:hypothetical protein
MGRVLTNTFSLSYAIQSAFDVFTTSVGDWKLLEPNEIQNFGPEITTVSRNPISKIRGARPGTITDLDAAVEFTADLTLDSFLDFIEGFAFATAVNADLTITPSAVVASTDAYTVAALSAAQADKLEWASAQYATLIYARGHSDSANNGIKSLDADIATSAVAVTVAEALVDETPSATQNNSIELAGLRSLAAAVDFTWTWDSGTKQATLASAADITDFQQFGLVPGMFVHIGSPDSAGATVNGFENAAANDMVGYARIVSVSATAGTIVCDKVDAALQFTDGTAPTTALDLLFGIFVRPVAVDSSEFLERIFLFEGAWSNLFETTPPTPVANPDGFEYLVNSYCNQLAWSLPLTDKSTVTFAFVSTDAQDPVDNASRKTGASVPLVPVQDAALNTSSNITRLRVTDVDETGLTTDFKALTLTINNNVTPEKVLGVLGARFINIGNLAVTIEGNILFTSPLVPARIRANATVSMDTIVKNADGAIVTDIPSMKLGGGSRELPVNESVQLTLTGEAFIDPVLDTVFGITIFPIVP